MEAQMSKVTNLEKVIREGRLSRRDFMQRAAALGIGGIAAASAWKNHALASPSRGGHLKLGIGGGSVGEDLSPLTTGSIYLYVSRWAVYNNLIELDSDKNPVPELAESWDVSDGAKDWLFNIRKGVTFHNGKELDANDVIYSINLHRGEDTKSSAKPLLSAVTEIKAEGSHKVRFKLSEGQAEFLYSLADFAMNIVPDGFNDWNNAVGTGGYSVEHFEPGVSSTFKHNPNYWKSDRAHCDSVELLTITDPAARVAALRSGEVHVIDRVEAKVAARLDGVDGIDLVKTPAQNFFNSLMRCDEGPFSDNDVRLAFKYLLPREQMLQSLLQGFGTVGNDHPVPSSDPFFNSELPQRAYDPEKAKWHLNKAGHSSFAVDLYASQAAHPEAINAATLMQEAAKPAGVDINVVKAPADGYWSSIWRNKPFCMSIWGVRPTPSMQMTLAYRSDAPWNDTYFQNAHFDELLSMVKVEVDPAKRKQLYWDLQEILHNEAGAGIFSFIDTIDGYSTKVKGTRPDGVRELMGTRICERVWLEA